MESNISNKESYRRLRSVSQIGVKHQLFSNETVRSRIKKKRKREKEKIKNRNENVLFNLLRRFISNIFTQRQIKRWFLFTRRRKWFFSTDRYHHMFRISCHDGLWDVFVVFLSLFFTGSINKVRMATNVNHIICGTLWPSQIYRSMYASKMHRVKRI